MSSSEPLVLLILCIFGTFVWRVVGVAVADRIDLSSNLFQWFNCVAYAMLAGLITRVLLVPSGTLALVSGFDRVSAIIIGLIVFFIFRRNVFFGTGAAFFAFLGLMTAEHLNLF